MRHLPYNLLRLFGLLALLLSLGVVPRSTAAQDANATPEQAEEFVAPRFNIRPAEGFGEDWVTAEVTPRGSAELSVQIDNFGDVPVDLRIWVADGFSMVNGGFAIRNEDDPVESTGTWITFAPETFTLAAAESTTRTFTVNVPADAEPGQYIAGIAVRTAEPLAIPGSTTFTQIIQSSLAVEIIVPGEIGASFELGEPAFFANENIRTLSVPVTNTGNLRVRPAGKLIVTDTTGTEVLTADVTMNSVYAGHETLLQVSLPMQVPFGDYLVSLDVTDPETGATATIADRPATLELATPTEIEPQTFTIDSLSISPVGDPMQYVDVTASITNSGQAIPTADVTLVVQRDGQLVEEYPLVANAAIASGVVPFQARYIPAGGWQPGTYSFQLKISAVNAQDQSRTELATFDAPEPLVVP